MPAPLPPLIRLSDFGNDWDSYLEALYRIYLDEIVNSGLTFQGFPLRVQFRPMTHGKGFGFRHLISKGESEDERTPDLRRCERIRWIAWIIRNSASNNDIIWWENRRKSNTHTVLWFQRENFVVILAKRQNYYLLKSAYNLAPHRAKVFEKEWKQYWGKG